MFKQMNGNTIRDEVRNEGINKKLEIFQIKHKIREKRLKWFGYKQ